ncbi:MAG TPA: sarcosine oxidase subunit gamma family protein [Dongiaceae bacterium]|jgi:sarcosine oxidase subunit gamma
MVESYLRRSPLTHRALLTKAVDHLGDAELGMGERAHRMQLNIRGDRGDAAFVTALKGATGVDLPAEANRFTQAGERACLWLGPNEWLIVGPGGGEPELIAGLRTMFVGLHAAVTDVSESRTTLLLQGPRARDLLQKGMPIDLHPREFEPGHCAQSHLAGANVILRQIDGRPTYELLVLNSFAEHLWLWLESAAREFRAVILA